MFPLKNAKHWLASAALASGFLLDGQALAQVSPFEFHWPLWGVRGDHTAPPPEPDEGGNGSETPVDPPVPAPASLTLIGTLLPEATVGQPYYFDFKPFLTISGGNPTPLVSEVAWADDGGLPADFTLEVDGTLTGTPSAEGGASFEVVASHGGAEGRQVFTIVVNGVALQVVQIAVGDLHTCAVTTDGAAKCWGNNTEGQLGDGTTTSRSTPVTVSGLASGVSLIAAGYRHSCAATASGAAYCWGDNSVGGLGDNTTTDRRSPVQVSGLTSGVSAITAGGSYSCAVHGGAAKCWGSNGGRLGDGTLTSRRTPVQVSGLTSGVTDVVAGFGHACAIADGALRCWGENSSAQLGNGNTVDQLSPVAVTGLSSGVTRVAAATGHTCAVHAGAAKCWGSGTSGRLGNGSTSIQVAPSAVSGLSSATIDIAVGTMRSCALTTAGAVYCWGLNAGGGAYDGVTTERSTPELVQGLGSGVASIAAAGTHSCAVMSSGAAKCWGYNTNGKLGDGTTTERPTPVSVLP